MFLVFFCFFFLLERGNGIVDFWSAFFRARLDSPTLFMSGFDDGSGPPSFGWPSEKVEYTRLGGRCRD